MISGRGDIVNIDVKPQILRGQIGERPLRTAQRDRRFRRPRGGERRPHSGFAIAEDADRDRR